MEINEDILVGKWKQVHGRFKEGRGRLLHDERERVLGHLRIQVGLLQERRGRLVARLRRAAGRLDKLQTS